MSELWIGGTPSQDPPHGQVHVLQGSGCDIPPVVEAPGTRRQGGATVLAAADREFLMGNTSDAAGNLLFGRI